MFAAALVSAVVPRAHAAAAAQDAAPAAGAASTVSSGVYTEEQATRGEEVSTKLCTGCHGPELTGAEAGPNLVGPEFVGAWTGQTLADFFDRVNSTMPADAPGTLTPQQTSDVTAYVLKLNKYPAGEQELPTDMAELKKIAIVDPPPAQ